MAFWKKNKNEKLRSDEFEELSKRIVLAVADIDMLSNKYTLLLGSYRKLNLKVAKLAKEVVDEEAEKDLKSTKLYI